MKPAFAVSAIGAVVSFLSLYADARPVDHKIHHLRNEIIALDASLITYISEAENSVGDDDEQLHASIVAAHLETVDTSAAYRLAKPLIDDLDALRQHAIAELTLPSDYTPPNVLSTARKRCDRAGIGAGVHLCRFPQRRTLDDGHRGEVARHSAKIKKAR